MGFDDLDPRMPGLAETLDWTFYAMDATLLALGAALLISAVWRWWVDGRHDPLRGAPIRPNRLSPLLLWICLAGLLAAQVAGVKLATLSSPSGLEGDRLQEWRTLLGVNMAQIIIALMCLGLAQVGFTSGWRGLGLGRRPIGRELRDALTGWLGALVVCAIVFLATTLVIKLFDPDYTGRDHTVLTLLHDPATTTWIRVIAVGGAVIVAPLGEELFFRGIVQTSLKKLMPVRRGSMRHRWAAIGVTALLFGLMHMQTPHHVPTLAAFGFVLGFLYERYGSLTVVILVHALFNGKTLLYEVARLFVASG